MIKFSCSALSIQLIIKVNLIQSVLCQLLMTLKNSIRVRFLTHIKALTWRLKCPFTDFHSVLVSIGTLNLV